MARNPDYSLQNAVPLGAVHHVTTSAKVYAPTFDCCATCMKKFGVANNLVTDLKASNTKATFFLSGEWLAAHRDAARDIIKAKDSNRGLLFEVGFHGWSHSDFPLLSSNPKLMAHEINAPREAYQALVNDMFKKGELSEADYKKRMGANLFRFPTGHFNDAALAAVRDAKLIPVQWNATADGASRPQLHNGERLEGSITLAHANMSIDGVRKTDHTFASLHNNMSNQGYKAVTMSELLQYGKPAYTKTPETLTARDHRNIERNQAGNAQYGYGLSSYQQFMASLDTGTTRTAQRHAKTLNSSS